MRGFVRAIVWLAVILGALAFLVHLFVVEAWRVPSGDLPLPAAAAPALAAEDLVLVRRNGHPGLGELARCVSPVDGSFVVGRVLGEPGDHVELTKDRVLTNGKPLGSARACPPVLLPHPVSRSLVKMSCGVVDTGAWTFEVLTSAERSSVGHARADVGPGKLYLLSDNRTMHQDSRDFGTVDRETCRHVVYRLWGEKYADDARRFTLLW